MVSDTMELDQVEKIHDNLLNGNIKDSADMIAEDPANFFRTFDVYLEEYCPENRHRDFVRATLAYIGVLN